MISQETQQEFNTYLKKLINDNTLVESIMSGYNIIHEGVIGKALGTAALVGSLAMPAMANQTNDSIPNNPDEVKNYATELINDVQDEYLDTYDIDKSKAYKKVLTTYDTLKEKDPKLANLFARKINLNLHNELKIAPIIGNDPIATSDNTDDNNI